MKKGLYFALAWSVLIHAVFFCALHTTFKRAPLGRTYWPIQMVGEKKQSVAAMPFGRQNGLVPVSSVLTAGAEPGRASDVKSENYLLQLRERIQEQVHFSLALRRRGLSGRTLLTVVVNKDGHLDAVSIQESSGHRELDALALQAVQTAAPFLSFPPELQKQSHLTFQLPIDFRIK